MKDAIVAFGLGLMCGVLIGVTIARQPTPKHEHQFSNWSLPAAEHQSGRFFQIHTCTTCGLAESKDVVKK